MVARPLILNPPLSLSTSEHKPTTSSRTVAPRLASKAMPERAIPRPLQLLDRNRSPTPFAVSPTLSPPSSATSTTFSIEDPFPRPILSSSSRIDVSLLSHLPTAHSLQQHLRIYKRPSVDENPYRSSTLTTSTSSEQLRRPEPARRSRRADELVVRHIEDDRRSSSEVDLDLSFELEREIEARAHGNDWTGIDMSRDQDLRASLESGSSRDSGFLPFQTSARTHDLSEGELVRSPSGKLMGTKRLRYKSAVELRAAYAVGELAAGEAGQDDEWEAAVRAQGMRNVSPLLDGQSSSKTDWIRQASPDPMSGRPLSRNGFLFNPLDPRTVPLPHSPIDPDGYASSDSSDVRVKKKRGVRLPVKLVLGRARAIGSPLASPSWSMGTYLNSPTSIPSPGLGRVTETVLDEYEEGIELKEVTTEAPYVRIVPTQGRGGWNRLATTFGFLAGLKPGGSTVSPHSSPLFDEFGSPRYESSDGTTPDGTPDFGCIDQEFVSPDVVAGPRTRGQQLRGRMGVVGLSGLGLDLGEEDSSPPRPPHAAPIAHRSLSLPIPAHFAESALRAPHPTLSLRSADVSVTTSPSTRLSSRRNTGVEVSVQITVDHGTPSPPRPRNLFRASSADPLPRPRQTASLDPRFSFVPQPLTLVRHLRSSLPLPTPIVQTRPALRLRRDSSFDATFFHPRLELLTLGSLDLVVPSKLFFFLGFLLGPWFWVFGALCLRPLDGELWSTQGLRCRGTKCNCGKMVNRSHGLMRDRKSWGGVDQWVFVNRCASVTFAGVGMPLLGWALWAAATL